MHCNWRGLGESCRHCFEETIEAYLADEVAKSRGSRVILCRTHEPPDTVLSRVGETEVPVVAGADAGGVRSNLDISAPLQDDGVGGSDVGNKIDQSTIPFVGNTTRGQICAYIPGYFPFLKETSIAVSSILHFMPGVRIGIVTSVNDFQVFNRYLGIPAAAAYREKPNLDYCLIPSSDVNRHVPGFITMFLGPSFDNV